MVSCAACGCSRTTKNTCLGITFHVFPKDLPRRQAWIDFINKPGWIPKGVSYMCSQHFAETCFDRSSSLKIRLLPTALPTIEVSRLKYVRTFNPVHTRVVNVDKLCGVPGPSVPPAEKVNYDVVAVPRPSTSCADYPSYGIPTEIEPAVARTPSPTEGDSICVKELPQDTPRKKFLKRKISDLQKHDLLKSHKIRRLQKVVWQQKKQILSLKSMTVELKKKNLMLQEHETILLEQFGTNKDIIKRLFQKTQKKAVSQKFEQSVRAFAVTLHFFSPKAYNYVRQKFQNSLPHPKTLSKWYSSVDAKPGFTSEAFNFLKLKVAICEQPLVCSLVFDEIAIRQHLEYSGDRYYGYVDWGNSLHGDSMELAREALVFMLVCINQAWKIPLGYFFISGINSEQKASLTKQALSLLKDVGVIVMNITFDGCPANFSMCNLLNCQFNKHSIKADFVFDNYKYFIYPDPVHMLKLIRNCFGERKTFIDATGNVIDFSYLTMLNELQEKEGLHLGTKLRRQHVQFFKQKMKVKLATQLLSRSVSEALLYCRDQLALKEFKNCGPTTEFVLLLNDAFDILNTHKISDFGFKQAACPSNISNIKLFFLKLYDYLINLKHSDGIPVLDSPRKTGFVGILVAMQSLIGMYEEYIDQRQILKFLPTYKLNQDHLELFFGTIRSQGGHNNNPTCRQFTAAYRKILIHAEVREGGAGNCVPLEQVNILNISSKTKPALQILHESVQSFEENVNYEGTIDIDLSNKLDNIFDLSPLSSYSLEVIKYIAGFVAFKLGQQLRCEHCISVLFGDKENFFHSLISHKSKGGLSYPSQDLINICIYCEKLLRIEQIQKVHKIDKKALSLKVLEYFLGRNVFSNMIMHDINPLESHKVLLLKSVCDMFLNVRIHFICKNAMQNEKIRNMYTKLIIFKGQ